MSLARAFTKRVRRPDASIGRMDSIRNQISGPVALISTTNMLSYNAPDLVDCRSKPVENTIPSTPSTPTRSSIDNDSDDSMASGASTDATSVDSSPMAMRSPSYFEKSPSSSPARDIVSVDDTPTLPKRALSHSKREHERLARKRSLQHSRPTSAQATRETSILHPNVDIGRSSASSLTTDAHSGNPFSRELDQLSEVAEEFSGGVVKDATVEEDLAVMQAKGLMQFAADDYFQEIRPLWKIVFGEVLPQVEMQAWI